MSRKLIAEQVRECVEDLYWEGYNDGYVHRGHGIEETDWQKITDELNAALGSGTLGNNTLIAELEELVRDLHADLMEYGCTPNAHRANYKPRFEALGIEVNDDVQVW